MKRKYFSRFFALLLGAAAALCFSACASTTSNGVVGAGRSQLLLISEEQMAQSAAESYAQVLAEAKSAGTLLASTDSQYKRVNQIAARLIEKTTAFRDDAIGWSWEVNVIKDSTINAWCMPGGKIVVYTGIINSLNLTDGELAAVMGHEISHALKEHSREQSSKQVLQQLGISVFSAATGLSETQSAALQLGAQLGVTLPFSRKCETEADQMGTELMARAGYDPYEAVSIWEKMSALTTSSTPEMLSTHPSNESRIADLQKTAKKVYSLYEATK